MTTLRASEARIPPDIYGRVAYKGERVRVKRRNEEEVFIVSKEDFELLQALEDRYWAEAAREAVGEMKAKKEKPIPWKDLKAELGL